MRALNAVCSIDAEDDRVQADTHCYLSAVATSVTVDKICMHARRLALLHLITGHGLTVTSPVQR